MKLRDYSERWPELEAIDNVFATVISGHLRTRYMTSWADRVIDAAALEDVFAMDP